jgi:hypothetical protein
MTGTALVVPQTERRLGVMNIHKVDISKAKASLAARGSSVRLFPGEALNFKKGRWYFGFNKTKRQRVKDGTEFVMNLANTVETWQTFVDGRPRFAPLAYVVNGEGRAPREEMGQLDESKWDVGDDGSAMDPVQAITVCPIRHKGKTDLHHITLGSVSSRIAFDNLLGDWLDQYEANPGKLPVVRLLEAEERQTRDGKMSYLVPAFEIVGWEKATTVDNPGPNGIQVAGEEDLPPAGGGDDDDEDEPAPRKRGRPSTKAARREPEPEDDEVEEDEPEQKPDPRKGNGFSTRRAKDVEEVEEDEDDKPKMVRRSGAAATATPARRPAPPPQDEDDEDEAPRQPVRKRRAALV